MEDNPYRHQQLKILNPLTIKNFIYRARGRAMTHVHHNHVQKVNQLNME